LLPHGVLRLGFDRIGITCVQQVRIFARESRKKTVNKRRPFKLPPASASGTEWDGAAAPANVNRTSFSSLAEALRNT
jgi:hypothetical protein